MNYNVLGEPEKKYDGFLFGLLLSLFLPALAIFLILLFKYSTSSMEERLLSIWHDMYFVRYITLALIPNLVLFFVFYKTERWKPCYGLGVATLIYSMVSVFQLL